MRGFRRGLMKMSRNESQINFKKFSGQVEVKFSFRNLKSIPAERTKVNHFVFR